MGQSLVPAPTTQLCCYADCGRCTKGQGGCGHPIYLLVRSTPSPSLNPTLTNAHRLVLLLRFVLPVFMFDWLSKVLGGMDGMRTFKGHASRAEAEKKSADTLQKED